MPEIPDSNPRPSLRDVARAVGMSHVAVSLALRDSPRVSEKRRTEVKAMAEKLGYRPDPMLASLGAYRRGKQQMSIRACLGWLNLWERPEDLRAHREFDQYWLGAKEAAERLGYNLEEFRWSAGKSGKRLQNILETRGVRGLLIPPHREDFDLRDFDWGCFSLVRFGASVSNLPVHTVTSDQSDCSRLAYERALELGYKRIGYVSDETLEKNTRGHFREGYLNARDELATRSSRLEALLLGGDMRQNQNEFKKWVRKQRPDAIVTTVSQVRSFLAALELRIPEDIAVATTSVLDGSFEAGADQNSHEIGRVAVSTLAGLVLENACGIPKYMRRILVQGRWVDGSSMPSRTGDVQNIASKASS